MARIFIAYFVMLFWQYTSEDIQIQVEYTFSQECKAYLTLFYFCAILIAKEVKFTLHSETGGDTVE